MPPRYSNRFGILILALALANLTFVTGCSSSGVTLGGPGPGEMGSGQPETEEVDERYVRQLRQKPPSQLTKKEIAYLEMAAEKRQADHLKIMSTVTSLGFVMALIGGGLALYSSQSE